MINETIYAPSTAIGGAIAIIRVSGSRSKTISKEIFSKDITGLPNRLCYVLLKDGEGIVDACMGVFLPAPHTYTGEDMLEIHCHGGAMTVQSVLKCLSRTGARPAENGEFTKRAFLNGKMDLSQAEAVMDIINAEAQQSLKAALLQHEGSVKRQIEAVEGILLNTLSGIDAAIDYPEEAEADAYASLGESLDTATDEINRLLKTGRDNRVLRIGVSLAIVGKPNVGKSSLLNALLGRDRAIVTAAAGTTRDTIEEKLSIEGIPMRIVDTAGIRACSDEAESIGIERAKQVLDSADLVLLVTDGSEALDSNDSQLMSMTARKNRIIVSNKADICKADRDADVYVSAKTGVGMDELKSLIVGRIAPNTTDCTAITNERHLRALECALVGIEAAKEACQLDCIATDIRESLHHLGSITGTDIDEKVLDKIFENFCVGK
ncbi:MAG: tRNA uridine-5-carboxymethylaminomethyl(34) synthesis GTPase MnmE [Eubacteriales bacterium]|nr:tRNA uridine-5-carboxymethylaminomethyl(34) synthesis GTPase MnmE [Eubacteriales bacterium]